MKNFFVMFCPLKPCCLLVHDANNILFLLERKPEANNVLYSSASTTWSIDGWPFLLVATELHLKVYGCAILSECRGEQRHFESLFAIHYHTCLLGINSSMWREDAGERGGGAVSDPDSSKSPV